MWMLYLNPVTANAENSAPVARAETREALESFVESEMANEGYRDGSWYKTFKQGSPLEMYNSPTENPWYLCFVDIGTLKSWTERAVADWNNMLTEIPPV